MVTNPDNLTMQDAEEHDVTHTPDRVQCSLCVRGKAAGEVVGEEAERLPKISMHYEFLGDTDERRNPTNANETLVLVISDNWSQGVLRICPQRGLQSCSGLQEPSCRAQRFFGMRRSCG